MNTRIILNPLEHVCQSHQIYPSVVTRSNLHVLETTLSPNASVRFNIGSMQYSTGNGSIHDLHFSNRLACPTCMSLGRYPVDFIGILSCCGRFYCNKCIQNDKSAVSVVVYCRSCGLPLCRKDAVFMDDLRGNLVPVHRYCQYVYQDQLRYQERIRLQYHQNRSF